MIFGKNLATSMMLTGFVLSASSAFAIDVSGAWATDAQQCGNVFAKKGKQVTFAKLSEDYGSGFIIEGDRIRGKIARCTIKTRKEEGDTLHLLASCATDVMLQSVQFSLRILNDDTVSRVFPGISGMEVNYYRCKL